MTAQRWSPADSCPSLADTGPRGPGRIGACFRGPAHNPLGATITPKGRPPAAPWGEAGMGCGHRAVCVHAGAHTLGLEGREVCATPTVVGLSHPLPLSLGDPQPGVGAAGQTDRGPSSPSRPLIPLVLALLSQHARGAPAGPGPDRRGGVCLLGCGDQEVPKEESLWRRGQGAPATASSPSSPQNLQRSEGP